MTSTPRTSKTATSGIIHQIFLRHMKENNAPAMRNRAKALRKKRMTGFKRGSPDKRLTVTTKNRKSHR